MDRQSTYATDPNGVLNPFMLDSFDHTTGALTWPQISAMRGIGIGESPMVGAVTADEISNARQHLADHAPWWLHVRARLAERFPRVFRHPVLVGDLKVIPRGVSVPL
jgi:hypothetical protein